MGIVFSVEFKVKRRLLDGNANMRGKTMGEIFGQVNSEAINDVGQQ